MICINVFGPIRTSQKYIKVVRNAINTLTKSIFFTFSDTMTSKSRTSILWVLGISDRRLYHLKDLRISDRLVIYGFVISLIVFKISRDVKREAKVPLPPSGGNTRPLPLNYFNPLDLIMILMINVHEI